MIEPENVATATFETSTFDRQLRHSHPHSLASPGSADFRVMELETENSRLQRLVAELLLKNQVLRKGQE